MPCLAAIDIGTNSVKMTIAEVERGKPLDIVDELSEITRLGRGVDKTKSLSVDSIEATLTALTGFASKAHEMGAQIIAGGTSAIRDASNGKEFTERASKIIGAEVQIIEGAREAKLAFLGAMSDAKNTSNGEGLVLVFDVGGGSTELIVGDGEAIKRSDSLDMGAVRLTERFLHADPASEVQINSACEEIDRQLGKFDLNSAQTVIGIGGTAVTLLSALNESGGGHQETNELSVDDLNSLFEKLAPLTVEQKRQIKGLEPKRADIIFAGLLILMEILRKTGHHSITVSSRGVRHGLLIEAAQQMS